VCVRVCVCVCICIYLSIHAVLAYVKVLSFS